MCIRDRVYSEKGLATKGKDDKAYFTSFHTSTTELAKIANLVQPKLLVLSHQLPLGVSLPSLLEEIKVKYKGAVVNGNDLDVY